MATTVSPACTQVRRRSARRRQAAIADTLLGFPATYSVQTTPYEQRLRYSNAALYFQEDWRATSQSDSESRLALGVFSQAHTIFSIESPRFDLATGQQLLPGQNGTPRSLINADMNNFGPRFGFARRTLGKLERRCARCIRRILQPAYRQRFPLARDSRIRSRFWSPARTGRRARRVRCRSSLRPIRWRARPCSESHARRYRSKPARCLCSAVESQHSKMITTNSFGRLLNAVRRAHACKPRPNYNEIFPNPPQPPNFVQIFPYPNLAAVSVLESRGAANYHA